MSTAQDAFRTQVAAVTEVDGGLELRVTLHNTTDRALHYLSAVRALDYDPATRRLTVRLSDEGREVVPGAANMRPPVSRVDPGADAEVVLRLPETISRLVPSRDGDPERVAFERLRIADAVEVVVEVAWADVPFYPDPREHDELVLPSVHWQQHTARSSLAREGRPAAEPDGDQPDRPSTG